MVFKMIVKTNLLWDGTMLKKLISTNPKKITRLALVVIILVFFVKSVYLFTTYLLPTKVYLFTFVTHFCWYEISKEISFDFFINNLFFRQIRCLHFQFRRIWSSQRNGQICCGMGPH